MEFADIPVAARAVVILIGAVVAWMVLRIALRFTIRLFTIGCLAIAVIAIIGGLASWLS